MFCHGGFFRRASPEILSTSARVLGTAGCTPSSSFRCTLFHPKRTRDDDAIVVRKSAQRQFQFFRSDSPCRGSVFQRSSPSTQGTIWVLSTSNRSSPLPSCSTTSVSVLSLPRSRVHVALKSVRNTVSSNCNCHVIRASVKNSVISLGHSSPRLSPVFVQNRLSSPVAVPLPSRHRPDFDFPRRGLKPTFLGCHAGMLTWPWAPLSLPEVSLHLGAK
jgi:hypothetical protein